MKPCEPSPGQPQAEPRIDSTRGIAAHFRVSTRTAQYWRQDPTFPAPGEEGAWDVSELEDWRLIQLMADEPELSEDAKRLLKARASEREAKAALAALEVEKLREAHMPVTEVRARDRARVRIVRRGIEKLARRLPGELVGLHEQAMQAIVREEARELLNWFSAQ